MRVIFMHSKLHPMDKKINKSPKKGALIGLGLLTLLLIGYLSLVTIDKNINLEDEIFLRPQLLTLKETTRVRAEFRPSDESPIDAVSNGIIIKRHVKDGERVEIGQPIVTISNTELELGVLRTESDIEDQISTLESRLIDGRRNRLDLEAGVRELEFSLLNAEQELEENQLLLSKSIISEEAVNRQKRRVKQVQTQLETARLRLDLEDEREKEVSSRLQDVRKTSERRRRILRERTASLIMKAKTSGTVTGFDILEGSQVKLSQRLGSISGDDSFRLEAEVNEFFLNRLNVGSTATVMLDGSSYEAILDVIKPSISDGSATVQLIANAEELKRMAKVGRTAVVEIDLEPGPEVLALPIKVTSYNKPEGLTVESNGSRFIRKIGFGRKDKNYVEVVSGLSAEEAVILLIEK